MKSTLRIPVLTALTACLLVSGALHAQTQLPKSAIQITGGYSHHGSGDMNGIVFGTEYLNYLSKKFALNYNFRAGINNSTYPLHYYDPVIGKQRDASVRFTTAGVQAGVNVQYSMIRNRKDQFSVSLGAFGRYQSASNGTDGFSVYNPNTTDIPAILIGYDNTSPQKTYAVGGIFQLQYDHAFSNNVFIGLAPGFQTDTNGDAIPQAVIIVGKRF